jgi:hypothetical protein
MILVIFVSQGKKCTGIQKTFKAEFFTDEVVVMTSGKDRECTLNNPRSDGRDGAATPTWLDAGRCLAVDL